MAPSNGSQHDSERAGRLSEGVLGTSDIVFMVMAAAAPMAVVVALMPMAFAFGNGAGVPGTYLAAIGAMLLFAVGYVRIIPHVRNAGAFYAYIAASLGRALGLAAAYVAALCYFALSCSTLSALAFFAAQFVQNHFGTAVHWSIWAFGSIACVAWLSYRRITLAAKVLTAALGAEVALILLLDFAILRDVGLRGVELGSFAPGTVLAPGLGIAAMYAFNSVIGVEGTAIYQEEARDRARTVPRATYLAVALVGAFYVLTAWCITSSAGAQNVGAMARQDPGMFIENMMQRHLGTVGATTMSVLVLTSAFAAVLALFNNSARYLYALARDGVLPPVLARTHFAHQSPHVAGLVLTIALSLVIGVCAAAGLDPLVNVTTALVGLGSVGLMALLAITALAIPVYFLRRQAFGLGTVVAPAIGGLLISAATVLAFVNYPTLTGVDSAVINRLPYLLLVIAAAGAMQALWLKHADAARYERIGSTRIEET